MPFNRFHLAASTGRPVWIVHYTGILRHYYKCLMSCNGISGLKHSYTHAHTHTYTHARALTDFITRVTFGYIISLKFIWKKFYKPWITVNFLKIPSQLYIYNSFWKLLKCEQSIVTGNVVILHLISSKLMTL